MNLENRAEPLILTYEELCLLTGRTRHRAQANVLTQMGFIHKIRPDGFPVVSRAHFESVMGGVTAKVRLARPVEPNWAALDGYGRRKK